MARRPQHWAIGGFILLAVFVIAFVLVGLLVSQGIGLPATFLILPSEATLGPGAGWQFQAVAGDRIVPGVKWTATDGYIGPEGFYVAPDTPGDYQIFAQHPNSNYRAAATVHVVATNSITTEQPPSPAETMTPAQSTTVPAEPLIETPAAPTPSSPTLAPVQTSLPLSTLFLDDTSDLVNLDTLNSVTAAPPGTDIKAACFDSNRRLVRAVPEELAGEVSDWDPGANVILWIMFHEPIPTIPDVERYWIFALDVDANTATGRPVGEGKINPDIGVEATIGVYSNPAAGIETTPYILIWNAGLGNSEYRTLDLEIRLNTTRDTLFIRVPVESLTEAIRTLSEVEPNWDQAVGRALATATEGEGAIADFAPERP